MDVFTLIVAGLVAGALASSVLGSGYGMLGDMLVGAVGAILAGWGIGAFHLYTPFSGLAKTGFVAVVGAAGLLLILRAISGKRLQREP